MKKLSLVIAALLILGITSCKKDDNSTPKDTTKPTVNLMSPSEDDEFTSGNAITVNATITDDTELSQAKIEIHENFDGHTHMKTGAPAFSWDSIIDLSGKTTTLNFKIDLPIDIATGNYDFTMRVIDQQGNEADVVLAEIKLKNVKDSIAPTLQITATPAPGTDGKIKLQGTNNEITLAATIDDDQELKSYEIKLIHKTSNKNYKDIDGTFTGKSGTINEKIVFDAALPKGEYLLLIEAFDLKNNDADAEFDVVWD